MADSKGPDTRRAIKKLANHMLPLRFTQSPVLGFVLKALFAVLSLLTVYYVVDATKAHIISAATPETVDSEDIDTWWPANGVTVEGEQPFKFFMPDRSVESYNAFWSVDGGSENEMFNDYTDYPHKEVTVDLSGWTWRGEGPYLISFVAREKSGEEIARESLVIYTGDDGAERDYQDESADDEVRDTSDEDDRNDDDSNDEVEEIVTASDISEKVDEAAEDSSVEVEEVGEINVWWPTDNARLSGTQPLKAIISGTDTTEYDMYWRVDGDDWHQMGNSNDDYPHKEATIDVSEWDGDDEGEYTIEFRAERNDAVIAENSVDVYVENYSERATTQNSASTDELSVDFEETSVTKSVDSVVPNGDFYIDPYSRAKAQSDEWQSSRPEDAALMDILAAQPTASWFGDWNGNVYQDVRDKVAAAGDDKTSVLIAYNIPQRDCGHYSAGGAGSFAAYGNWISDLARGIGSSKAIVVLEPDAIAGMDCLSAADQEKRIAAISEAVRTLKNQENVSVYIDAGNPNWKSADEMADRLTRAGVSDADGFALNVSNFFTTEDNVSYGEDLSSKLGGKHFVVDTSRNGNGPADNHEWCNPRGRGLGQLPTFDTGNSLVDAFLWLKMPGESDGSCNGDPGAGQWFPEYALELVKNRAF